MLECIAGIVVWTVVALIVLEFIKWFLAKVVETEVPARIIQLITFLIAFIAVIGLVMCIIGQGPLMPLPWRRM